VADVGTMASAPPDRDAAGASEGRTVRRSRGLPGGRAVVGALLVAAAAVGVFAAYLNATAEPSTRYLVAREPVEPGTRLADVATIAELFEARPLDLAPDLAERAVRLDDAGSLVGRLVLAPLAPGDLLSRSALVADGGIADAHRISFAIDPADALGGDLRVGERIDVLATYGSGDGAYTAYVLRGVPLVARAGDGGTGTLAGGGGGPLTLTVAVTAPEDVQALAHAVAVAEVVVTRSTVLEGDRRSAPPPYVPSPDAAGPSPDPAGDPVGDADAPAPPTGDGPAAEGQDADDVVDDPTGDDG
jgi:hypothetical protein